MATIKTAAASLFGTVSDTAETLSAVVSTLSSGVHMLNDLVQAERIKQQHNIAVTLADHQLHTIQDHAMLNAERDKATNKWLLENPGMAETYIQHFNRLQALFAKPE